VVLADAQLIDRADHAVGDVTIGLTGGDRESPRQHRTGQRHHDGVTGGEVVRTTDDASGFRLPDVHLAPANDLAVLLRLVHGFEDASDHDRAADFSARDLNALDL